MLLDAAFGRSDKKESGLAKRGQAESADTGQPKTLWTFHRGKEQSWQRTDLGFHGPFPTMTGGIFEPGFPDCFLQTWSAFLAERAGKLQGRFGCVTPDEAVQSHRLFAAALQSFKEKRAISLD